MVGLSEASRVALGIFLLSGATIGGVWLVSDLAGPLHDDLPPYLESEGVFLVSYQLDQYEIETRTVPFSQLATLTFNGLEVPVQNVSTVEVTLQVAMDGPAVNDQYDVRVWDPQGTARTGSHTVPSVSPGGYIRSDTIITWKRVQQPSAESYRTPDPDKALAWSAANHTDPSARGNWNAEVELTPPLMTRNGNASLLFQFTFYEAIVLPKTQIRDDEGPPEPTGNATANNTSTPPPTTDAPGPSGRGTTSWPAERFEAIPRTFITTRPVGADVDRGRTADRPL